MTQLTPTVEHSTDPGRFACRVEGQLCRADYHLIDGVMWLTHTEVPPALEGRGIAAQLVKAALEHARAQGLRVKPACSYVRVYLKRHPEYQDLLATGD
ncbi:putative acetyltransferase [Burkholderiales bacterium JOSHI_001]|nr:putative acetyltransferase [Burkholderiales bacterium JOSHI_001]